LLAASPALSGTSLATVTGGSEIACGVSPYRIDLLDAGEAALERLVELGALDIESAPGGGMAALMPDRITAQEVARALGVARVAVSPAVGRDAESVWILSPRPIRIGSLQIVPAHFEAEAGALRLIDAPAFGTGLHPTTALCLEALDEAVRIETPGAVLDVGTGSGVLALGALMLGVPRAMAIDIDADAVTAAEKNAELNGLADRLQVTRGTPETVTGQWPIVLANVLAAPLIEMAPVLSRCVGHHGQLVLSGIGATLEPDVDRAYRHVGMQCVEVKSRDGWVALVLRASW
jgi:ribosomal protein L11 methyltransferase